jgi:hypothetical protein
MKKLVPLISIMLLVTLASPCQVGEVYYSPEGTNITKTPNDNDSVIHLPKNSKVELLNQLYDHKHEIISLPAFGR